jgi:hypothetical protein
MPGRIASFDTIFGFMDISVSSQINRLSHLATAKFQVLFRSLLKLSTKDDQQGNTFQNFVPSPRKETPGIQAKRSSIVRTNISCLKYI